MTSETMTFETTPPEKAGQLRRRRRGRAALIAGCAVLTPAMVAAAVGLGGDTETAAPRRPPPATAQVIRTTLTETTSVDGTLGYGSRETLTAAGRSGTITWLPSPGAMVRRGRAVYSVNADRVPLLYGDMPLYRTLRTGVKGRDVELLERNLAKLGYRGITVDQEFTWATREAVRRWQRNIGVPVTGQVEPGDVFVHPGPIRVAELKTTLGGPAPGPVLAYTGTTKRVTVPLDAADRHLVKKGMKATVKLPGGATVPGVVTGIGKVASESIEQGETVITIEVVVSVRERRARGKLRAFDTAPVKVAVVAEQRENVLAVPVNALIALPGGGYGVEVVQGAVTRSVPVRTGMFADGKVEIAGIDEGTTVVVPT
ncbi:peptidoglycan-binding protein [Microtetraspora glauca]|uniref:Peptidoglycan-binding protein n=1 Tax=Microtetraspora glauca TaxID=1996 RepID=A0ABV3GJC4_MICGL